MVRPLFLLTTALSIAFPGQVALAEDRPIEIETSPVRIQASSLRPSDSGVETSAWRESTDQTVAETAVRLPGINVQQYGGPNGSTTITGVAATSAGETPVTLEGIPIEKPSGTGFDFSLFPAAAITSVQRVRPDAATDRPWSPVDGINLNLCEDDLPGWHWGILSGSDQSSRLSMGYQTVRPSAHWSLSTDFIASRGRFPFNSPVNGGSEKRRDNGVTGGSWAIGYRRPGSGDVGEWRLFHLFSAFSRSTPGRLTAPDPGQQRDLLGIVGTTYRRQDFRFGSVFGYSELRSESGYIPFTRQHSKTFVLTAENTVQTPLVPLRFEAQNFYSDLTTSGELHRQDTIGVGLGTRLGAGENQLLPQVRLVWNSEDHGTVDARAAWLSKPSRGVHSSVSYAFIHQHPDLVSRYGYPGALLPNPSLKTEKNHTLSAFLAWEPEHATLSLEAFFRQAYDKPSYVQIDSWSGRMENFKRVRMIGVVLSAEKDTSSPIGPITAGLRSTLSQTTDLDSHKTLPYRSPLQGSLFSTFHPILKTRLTLEQRWTGPRYTDVTNHHQLSAFTATEVRAEHAFAGGQFFVRMTNVFNNEGWMTEGFPEPGRVFFIGYRR